jgi:hypothetical protein
VQRPRKVPSRRKRPWHISTGDVGGTAILIPRSNRRRNSTVRVNTGSSADQPLYLYAADPSFSCLAFMRAKSRLALPRVLSQGEVCTRPIKKALGRALSRYGDRQYAYPEERFRAARQAAAFLFLEKRTQQALSGCAPTSQPLRKFPQSHERGPQTATEVAVEPAAFRRARRAGAR